MRRVSWSAATIRVSPLSRKTPGSILIFAGRGTMFNSAAGRLARRHLLPRRRRSRSVERIAIRSAAFIAALFRERFEGNPLKLDGLAGAMPSSAAAISLPPRTRGSRL